MENNSKLEAVIKRPVPRHWMYTDTILVVLASAAAVHVANPATLDQLLNTPEMLFSPLTIMALAAAWLCCYVWFAFQRPYNNIYPWAPARASRGQKPTEFPPPFPNGWFPLCPSHELQKGEVMKCDVLGQNLVLFRDFKGKAAVLEAWCPHLGAHLGVGGTISRKSNCLRCPFHGWEFDSEGRCKFVEGTDVVPADSNIRAFPVDETNQLIFFWHDAEGGEPTWNIKPHKGVNTGKWYPAGRTYTEINAHIQELPENGADAAHLDVLHKDFVWTALAPAMTHGWSACWAPHPTEKHQSSIELHQSIKILGFKIPCGDIKAHIIQHGPALVENRLHTFFGTVVVFECVTPVKPTVLQVYHTMHASPTVPRFLARLMLWAFESQFSRDIDIWTNKKYLSKPKISKVDGPILAFRRWYKQFYSAASLSFADAVAKENMLDW